MKTFSIYGASDDLIETSGIDGCDEFNVFNGPWKLFIEDSNKERVGIVANYEGSWAFSIFAVEGDSDAFPSWFDYNKVRRFWAKDSRYSETLEIDAPEDAKLIFKTND